MHRRDGAGDLEKPALAALAEARNHIHSVLYFFDQVPYGTYPEMPQGRAKDIVKGGILKNKEWCVRATQQTLTCLLDTKNSE